MVAQQNELNIPESYTLKMDKMVNLCNVYLNTVKTIEDKKVNSERLRKNSSLLAAPEAGELKRCSDLRDRGGGVSDAGLPTRQLTFFF